MIARLFATTALMFTLSVPLAQAAPPFAPVDDSFEGTRFRGLALGQSRAEIEAALATNGYRCLTSDEFNYGPSEGSGYTTCNIVRTNFVLNDITRIEILVHYDVGQKLGLPYHAVSFVNDIASAITLDPSYFNAAGTPYGFAEQIVANYGIIDGMASYGSGWRGVTANDETVLVLTLYNGRAAVLVVLATTEATTPTFN